MIGIEEVGIYLPKVCVNNLVRMEEFGVDEEFLRYKTGVTQFHISEQGQETSDLCVKAFADLVQRSDISASDLECVVVCTQNPDGHGLPHTSAIVHEKLGLSKSCAVFDISLGCSGYIYGLSIVKAFMEANGFAKGVLFTSDPYSKIIDPKDKNTSLLFGDGATATLLTDTPAYQIGRFVLGSDGSKSAAIKVCTESGLFQMNGRGVFNFAATTVPKNLMAAMEFNGVEKSDVDLYLLHQGSRYMVETIADRLAVPREKVPFEAAEYGNTVSSSIPMMLNKHLSEGATAKTVAISGFGVGLSWGSTILTKLEKVL